MILVLNSGSSSIKFALFGGGGEPARLLHDIVSDLDATPGFSAQDEEIVIARHACRLLGTAPA